LGSLGGARSAQQSIQDFVSQGKECTSKLYGVRKERARRAHQRDHKLKRNLKVTKYLKVGDYAKEA
jgi:hypothetical protein